MLLRDGETAILGGMIRDKESYSRLKVPGLGEIPLIGGLFTATNDTGDRTDLLLTITPRVVRRWETIDKDLSEIYSGTENNMSSEVKYYPSTIKSDVKDQGGKKSSRAKQAKGNISSTAGAAARQDGAGGTLNAVTISIAQQDAKAGVVNTAGSMGPQAIISFSEDQYILQNGQDSIIRIFAENIGGIEDMKVLVGFNQDYAGFIGAERSSPGIVSNLEVNSGQAANGVVELGLTMNTNINVPGKIELAALRFTGIKQGVSYLVFLANKIQNKEGIEVNIQRKTSRLLVQ
jgi:general secretion pathway protein D